MKKPKDSLETWMDIAGSYPLLTPEQTCLLAQKIQALPQGDLKRSKLVNKLVVHNLRLVASRVRAFLASGHSDRGWGSPETVDFLQVAATGVQRAAELYDPARGYTFATYASFWIRSKITRYGLKTRSLVSVSEAVSRKIISYKKNGFLKSRETGEIIEDSLIVPLLQEAKLALSCSSLNVRNEHDNEMLESIPDNSQAGVDHTLPESVSQALDAAGVSELGKRILMLRYGYGHSQKEVAEELGVSVETVKRNTHLAMCRAKHGKELAALV